RFSRDWSSDVCSSDLWRRRRSLPWPRRWLIFFRPEIERSYMANMADNDPRRRASDEQPTVPETGLPVTDPTAIDEQPTQPGAAQIGRASCRERVLIH